MAPQQEVIFKPWVAFGRILIGAVIGALVSFFWHSQLLPCAISGGAGAFAIDVICFGTCVAVARQHQELS